MSLPCPTCAAVVPDGSRVCPSCGAAPATIPADGLIGHSDHIHTLPGTVLAGRYRLDARLGRGGMGEVFRADDLTLGQPVALKFLAADTGRLAQFRQEVKLSRAVSHPNVCRVYDIVEAAGTPPFLVMEFVDGEDLSAVLARGRVPAARATAIARQVCLGLAAAHARGVLHRDLKPANILLDRDGEARIADFGLAVPAADGAAVSAVAGTPAYMAPEQLHGGPVSARTDLFALGLVLYELFAGRRLYPGPTLDDLKRQHAQGLPTRPLADGGPAIDPAVEQVILRCLAPDPADRPPSAAHVLLALPGDRLEAAVLAGEMPSPEMVVEADVGGGLRPAAAAGLLGVFLVGLLALACGRTHTTVLRTLPVKDHPPAVLRADARRLIANLGYPDPPRDTRSSYLWDFECLDFHQQTVGRAERWEQLKSGQPAVLYFWYLQSPAPLPAAGPHYPGIPGQATPGDPPMTGPGMTAVYLDVTGRLLRFHRVPTADDANGPPGGYDFRPLFGAAGLSMPAFTPAAADAPPPVACDQQAAWTGAFPDRPDLPLRVEAAAYRGRPVFFRLVGPWPQADPPVLVTGAHGAVVGDLIVLAVALAVAAVGVPVGWRNWRSGRGDWRAAGRLVLVVLGIELVLWAAHADHVPDLLGEMNLFWSGFGRTVLLAGLYGVAYLALEPYVRRRWPWRLVSWSRLLAGRVRDPAVGRDLLIGLCWGVIGPLIVQWTVLGPLLLGLPTDTYRPSPNRLTQPAVYGLALGLSEALAFGLPWFLMLCVLTAALRSQAAAVGLVGVGIIATYHPWRHEYPVLCTGLFVAAYLGGAVIALRYGLLAVVALFVAEKIIGSAALTVDGRAWYAGTAWTEAAAVLALAGYGYWTAAGGRPLLGRTILSGD